jgi:hypothetical protein
MIYCKRIHFLNSVSFAICASKFIKLCKNLCSGMYKSAETLELQIGQLHWESGSHIIG